MVRREEWDHAWEFVMSILRTQGWKERVGIPSEHGDRMPLAIWTEFMSTAKRGPFRRSIASEQGGRYEGEEEVLTAEPSEDQKEQASRALTSRRLNILMKYTPSLTPTECMRMPARTVSFIVWMMLVARHFGDARDMTRSYIAGLPPRLSTTTIRASLDIIHLHITGPTNRSPLHEHYNNRRTVEMFFAMHQDIKPDARTLFLLLRSLRRTTYSGILSRQIAKAFCRKWGYRAESRRVRDRITTFAVKEGNGEVVDIEWRKEMQSRLQERTYAVQTEVLGRTGRPPYYRLLRQPTRKIYKKRGVNIWRWRHLAQKIRQMAKTEKLRADT
jgi:hypothetical protein